MEDRKLLQFAPFSSALDAGFWYQLSRKKLDEYRLEDGAIEICGFYTNGKVTAMSPVANIDYTSFNDDLQVPPKSLPLKGILLNTNTLEEFKMRDKKELLHDLGKQVWEDIKSKAALLDPSLLQRILCLTFADLKKYRYYYWVAFPAFLYPEVSCDRLMHLNKYFNENQVLQLLSGYGALCSVERICFIVHILEDENIRVLTLKDYDTVCTESGKVILGFSDPSTFASHPGWPLRNLLTLVAVHWSQKRSVWDVICFRENYREGKMFCDHSLVLSVNILDDSVPNECPKTVGWEKNRNKLLPRMVDMSSSMDPVKLADAAVDLNLKLMKWRLVPDLQLDVISSAKCLLLGAGTLGCNVARCLLGWGVRNITLVDNSVVSFSNPVRQTLFQFEDCLNGGKHKAEAAANALKKIFPGVNSVGKLLNIPMPGHSLTENALQAVKSDVAQLENLIEAHDIVFLLMDTRESRWLPTVIAAAKKKIVINAALGFDTFLVMRHGVKGASQKEAVVEEQSWSVVSGCDLGCYFCSDVVAPGNSVRDRTLDQQCTVTRPGVSYMAAATAVELMVNVLQHSQRGEAPATASINDEKLVQYSTTHLGMVPHQIRGYLDKFQNMIHVSRFFDRCIACSQQVLEKYTTEGFDFLLKVFNDPSHLEDLTGISDLLNSVDSDDIYELSDDGSI